MNREELYRKLAEQKEEMRSEERLEAYLRGEETDYLPYGLLAPEDALAHIWGYTKGQVHRSFDIRCEMIRRKMSMVFTVCRFQWDLEESERLRVLC